MECIDVESTVSRALEDIHPAKRFKASDYSKEADGIISYPRITVNVGPLGSLHVWDPYDAIIMQSQHHVMGCATGCFAKTPLQDIFKSLPLRLTPAEAAYLRDSGAARFVSEDNLLKSPDRMDQAKFQAFREKEIFDQHSELAKSRQILLEQKKEQIMAGKMKKMAADAEAKGLALVLPEDTEELWKTIRAELLTRPVVNEGSARVELPFRSWRMGWGLDELPEVELPYPQTHAERVYYAAYQQLMKAGFWITSGLKYGGDLLLYQGDVHINHSICIVRIIEEDEEVPLEEILRLGRVATGCHKAVLWASVRHDYTVEFTCSKWSLMK